VKKFATENDLQVRFIPEMNLEEGSFGKVIGGEGGNCKNCNRLRLTATGKVKPCLFSDIEFDVRELGPEAAINLALGNKPKSGTVNSVNQFHNIGG
jgi:cyclic pyranopterin phosphate synthase